MTVKITILGCGGSAGVPVIGAGWGNCNPQNPKNTRLRASVLVQTENTTVLVDTSPDLRQQLLGTNISHLDGILYTHADADHTHGIDDLRAMNKAMGQPIQIYADPPTYQDLYQRFGYVFHEPKQMKGFYKPFLQHHPLQDQMVIGDLHIQAIAQDHGLDRTSWGFIFWSAQQPDIRLAYSTDVVALSDAALRSLAGVKHWVVDCVREAPHPTHSWLAQTLDWIKCVKPEKAWLTHMNETLDYDDLCHRLPPDIRPAFDGLILD